MKRLGVSPGISMHFELSNLITPRSNLHSLVEPWSHTEIDNIVKNMPNDKAPGPDGFNGLFLKKTWPIIKEDFYKLCDDFFEGIVDISGINRSYITLLPKITNPKTVHDYRPISLMNISPKLISKLVADILQGEILSLIHKNQHGFIKTRSIQDCLAWGFEYIHQCQQSKRETIILKLDFEKAFDTVEHEAILLFLDQQYF